MSKGSLIVVTGPSGAGKGTVLKRVLPHMDKLYYSVSLTTRRPRPGERDGIDYHFCSEAQAREMIANGQMLEYAEYVGNIYGTPAGPVDAQLSQGVDVVLEIEVQGALQVSARRPDAPLIFITTSSFTELERRLRGRGTESEEKVARRLATAREEYRQIDAFQFIVLNDQADTAAAELMAIIQAERCRTVRRREYLSI